MSANLEQARAVSSTTRAPRSLARDWRHPTTRANIRDLIGLVRQNLFGDEQAFSFLPLGAKVVARALWRTLRKINLARNSGIAPGANPPAALGKVEPEQVMNSRQIPFKDYSADIQAIVTNLYNRTYNDDRWGERFEFSTMVLELSDGTSVSTVGMEMTSGETCTVAHNMDQLDWILEKAGERGQMRPERLSGRIRFYSFHTHPQNEGLELLGTFVHDDGLFYTQLSPGDLLSAKGLLKYCGERLRAKGFTGQIEIVEAALPVPLIPLDEANTGYYVASLTLQIPALS
ncbi:hypothetical protein HZC35_00435 [Candidatus Saganbacteria bacterium]|nr:hypothetical protein [Candidatus Saganbacteria bacterium]